MSLAVAECLFIFDDGLDYAIVYILLFLYFAQDNSKFVGGSFGTKFSESMWFGPRKIFFEHTKPREGPESQILKPLRTANRVTYSVQLGGISKQSKGAECSP